MRSLDSKRERNRRLEVAFAAYAVVDEHRKLFGREPNGVTFNKMMTLLDWRLRERGLPLDVPYCWYRHGPEVVRRWMPTPLWMDHEDEKTVVLWLSRPPVQARHPTYEAIVEELRPLLAHYGEGGLHALLHDVYRQAPFEFQRRHLALRNGIHDMRQRDGRPAEEVARDLLPLIEGALEAFPAEEFPAVAPACTAAFEAARVVMRESPWAIRVADEMATRGWHLFCYHLRLHPRAHANVPEETKRVWSKELGPQAQVFSEVFRSLIHRVAEDVPGLLVDDAFASWVEGDPVGDDEFERLLDRLTPALDAVRGAS